MRLLLTGLLLAASAQADVLTLGEGKIVRGKVLKETADTLFVDAGYTVLAVPKKSILKREDDPKPGGAAAGPAVAERNEGLFSTIEREEASVKENVRRTEAAVVRIVAPGGSGSGFIVTPDGYVVTNDHVIQNETNISVYLFEKDKAGSLRKRKIEKVKLVAMNAYVDLALLKLEGVRDLPVAYLGDSPRQRVGQAVYAIGNPLGLERSVSEGIISTLNRAFEGLTYIQTTTPINPGNSGGPLFNLKGQVVGVTNMGIPAGEGLNFAIPVDRVKQFLKDRDAFAYDKDHPNAGYRYLPPPPKPGAATPER